MIQLVLSIGFAGTAGLFLSSRSPAHLAAWQKIGLSAFVTCALLAIFFPRLTTDLAHYVGVERGTDLLVYLTALVVPLLALATYTRFRVERVRTVDLARKVAFLESALESRPAPSIDLRSEVHDDVRSA
jgi:small membrane protein